mmetsp:Transcript_16197/g.41084  ORF Transcript_16197/g.41084 Transcript_16197/m.41084 type:complete len:282 (-) Transcript_16197:385-1230(-)
MRTFMNNQLSMTRRVSRYSRRISIVARRRSAARCAKMSFGRRCCVRRAIALVRHSWNHATTSRRGLYRCMIRCLRPCPRSRSSDFSFSLSIISSSTSCGWFFSSSSRSATLACQSRASQPRLASSTAMARRFFCSSFKIRLFLASTSLARWRARLVSCCCRVRSRRKRARITKRSCRSCSKSSVACSRARDWKKALPPMLLAKLPHSASISCSRSSSVSSSRLRLSRRNFSMNVTRRTLRKVALRSHHISGFGGTHTRGSPLRLHPHRWNCAGSLYATTSP